MCVILDTNMYGRFLNQKDADMEPVRDWVEKHGKIAYSPTSKMKKGAREISENGKQVSRIQSGEQIKAD